MQRSYQRVFDEKDERRTPSAGPREGSRGASKQSRRGRAPHRRLVNARILQRSSLARHLLNNVLQMIRPEEIQYAELTDNLPPVGTTIGQRFHLRRLLGQ